MNISRLLKLGVIGGGLMGLVLLAGARGVLRRPGCPEGRPPRRPA